MSCRRHSAPRRRRPGRCACSALPRERRRSAPCRTGAASSAVSHGKYRTVRFDARARGKSGRSADYSIPAPARRRRPGHRRDRYRTPDPRRVVSRRHDRGAIRGPVPRADRRTGAHRRYVPDRHVRRRRKAEGPHPVPSVGVDHAHPGGARPLGPDGSRRVRGRRDRDGRRQRRTRTRLRGAGMPDRVRGWHRSPLGRHRGRDAHGARCCRRRRGDCNNRVSVFATTPHKHTQILNMAPTPRSPRSGRHVVHESS